MTDDKIELTRRKILGSVGAVGAAGAAAGLGTSALFSDTEGFDGNSIAAGTLDLKVGWEEHYFNGKRNTDFTTDPDVSADNVTYVTGSPGSGNTTLPLATDSPENGTIVSVPDQQTALGLLNVTETAEYPSDYDSITDSNACTELPDGSEQSEVIIDLDDVKPGDFGEVTFSLALCDNPGYLWLQGCLQDSSEGGVNEPEADNSDEDQQEGTSDEPPLKSSSSGSKTVELLDEVQAAWWYDDGDNLQSGGGGSGGGGEEVDLSIVFDTSGSMDGDPLSNAKSGAKDLVDAVDSNVRVGLVSFEDAGDEMIEADLDDSNSDVKTAIDNLTAGGDTAIGAGIDLGQEQLTGNAGTGARSTADKVMVVLADGGENEGTTPTDSADNAKNSGTTIYSVAYGSGADNDLMEDISSPPKVDDGTIDSDDEFAFVADTSTISQTFSDIGGQVGGGEELINTGAVQSLGSLREILNELCPDPANDDYGLPLDGDQSTPFDEKNDPPDDSDREDFDANTVHDLGFAWWVPRDVGNQIQSDSATFSLSFYAVQSRNNSGSGSA